MRTNLRVDRELSPKRTGNQWRLLADPKTEKGLVGVLNAITAIQTTALTGTFFHSRDTIKDNYLLDFLSRRDVRVGLFLDSMIDADRTSFYVLWDKHQHQIILRINVTADKSPLWSIELRFRQFDGKLANHVFLDETKKQRVATVRT